MIETLVRGVRTMHICILDRNSMWTSQIKEILELNGYSVVSELDASCELIIVADPHFLPEVESVLGKTVFLGSVSWLEYGALNRIFLHMEAKPYSRSDIWAMFRRVLKKFREA